MYQVTITKNGIEVDFKTLLDGDTLIFEAPSPAKVLDKTNFKDWRIKRLEKQLENCHNVMKRRLKEIERLQGILDKVQV